MSDLLNDPTPIPQFQGDPQALLAMEPCMPMHTYIMHIFDPHTYTKEVGYPEWEATIDEKYISLIKN